MSQIFTGFFTADFLHHGFTSCKNNKMLFVYFIIVQIKQPGWIVLIEEL